MIAIILSLFEALKVVGVYIGASIVIAILLVLIGMLVTKAINNKKGAWFYLVEIINLICILIIFFITSIIVFYGVSKLYKDDLEWLIAYAICIAFFVYYWQRNKNI
jgi:hypothetical protein